MIATQAAGYTQGLLEAARKAAAANNVDMTVFDAQFDPQKQLAQCQDVLANGTYKVIITLPASSPGMVPCAEDAGRAKVPLIATNTPIGADLASTRPQVEGVTSQVMVPAVELWSYSKPMVVQACQGKNPCNVVSLIINPALALTTVQRDALDQATRENPNIKVLGHCQGDAQRQGGLKCMQDFLQREPNIHVIVTAAEDMGLGAEEALASAGKTLGKDVLMITEGGSLPGVERLRSGAWYATIHTDAEAEGRVPLELAARVGRGQPIPDFVNSTEASGVPQVLNKDVLTRFPDWKGSFPA